MHIQNWIQSSKVAPAIILVCLLSYVSYGQETEESEGSMYVFADGNLYDTRGYFYGFGLAVGIIDMENHESDEGLTAVHISNNYGYRWGSRLAASAGIGMEFTESQLAGFRIDTQFISLYAKVDYYMAMTRYRPYLFGRFGYGFGPANDEFAADHGSGANYQIGVGMVFPSRSKHKYHLQLYWHHQTASGRESYIDAFGNEIDTEYDLVIHRLMLGLIFEMN